MYVQIQAQDKTGNWRTFNQVLNNSQYILGAMQSLSRQFPDFRIRAIDNNGRVVDIL